MLCRCARPPGQPPSAASMASKLTCLCLQCACCRTRTGDSLPGTSFARHPAYAHRCVSCAFTASSCPQSHSACMQGRGARLSCKALVELLGGLCPLLCRRLVPVSLHNAHCLVALLSTAAEDIDLAKAIQISAIAIVSSRCWPGRKLQPAQLPCKAGEGEFFAQLLCHSTASAKVGQARRCRRQAVLIAMLCPRAACKHLQHSDACLQRLVKDSVLLCMHLTLIRHAQVEWVHAYLCH